MAVRRWLVFLLGGALATSVVAPAQAAFHLMAIQEVHAGSAANPGSEFVELQMFSAGQNFVSGHPVRFYSATGAPTSTATFAGPVPNGQNQRSILVATTAAEAEFGVAADLTIGAGLDPAGGAACFENIDCVAWGNFTGSLPSPAGTPEAAIADGRALCRSIARGDPKQHEAGDDTDDSAADFLPTPAAPRNNAGPAGGQPCPGDTGGGAADGDAPQTKITAHPPKTSDKTTAKFRFKSSEAGSAFQCKLDKQAFKECDSPHKYRDLDAGKHVFKVRATDRAGNTDKTPDSFRFKVSE